MRMKDWLYALRAKLAGFAKGEGIELLDIHTKTTFNSHISNPTNSPKYEAIYLCVTFCIAKDDPNDNSVYE